MTDEQTSETALLIAETYPSLNIADINLIFRNAKLGRYGKIYDRLDGQIILEWFDRYFDERCNAAAEQSIQEAEKYKGWQPDRHDRMQGLMRATIKRP